MNTLDTVTGSFTLYRWPCVTNDPLRAWDAADEYLLHHVHEDVSPTHQDKSPSILIINDAHGALATVLHSWQPQCWSDSVMSHRATGENFKTNRVPDSPRKLTSTQSPAGPLDLVLIKVPKTTALLEDQLYRLRPLCSADTKIIAAGMVKHLQKSAFTAFEHIIGPVTTSLARKKARLLFADLNMCLEPKPSPYPTSYVDEAVGKPLLNHANVFSRDHLDHGSRFFIQHFAALPNSRHVVDLACGNGVLGLLYQQAHDDSFMHFVDESYSAIESARCNHASWFSDGSRVAEFTAADGLELHASGALDLVLCNPPFHQQHAMGEQAARRLFESSKRCLRQHGELWIVANRHLDYPSALRQLFGNCRTVASNRKFSVYRAVKR